MGEEKEYIADHLQLQTPLPSSQRYAFYVAVTITWLYREWSTIQRKQILPTERRSKGDP